MSRLLVVCRGNVCRSPVAEHLLRAALPDTGITVASAGTHAMVGRPPDPVAVGFLTDRGIDVADARARQLDRAALRQADLVLVMSSAQRATVVTVEPAAVRRTFLLRQAARLLAVPGGVAPGEVAPGGVAPGAGPVERLAALPAVLATRRSQPPDGGEDVEDPYRRDDVVARRVYDEVALAVQALAGALTDGAGHPA